MQEVPRPTIRSLKIYFHLGRQFGWLVLLFFLSLCGMPAAEKQDYLQLIAKAPDQIQVCNAEGRSLVAFTGFQVKWTPNVKTRGGAVHEIVAEDGSRGYEVAYETDSPVKITGRFVKRAQRVDVQFDLSGLPEDAKIAGSMFGRTFARGASDLVMEKLGRWERPAAGGIPYEVADGKLLRYQIGNQGVCFAFDAQNKINSSWKNDGAQHTGLEKTGANSYTAKFSVLIPPADWPAEAIAAQWHERPLGLRIGTPRLYNWWTDNREPLKLSTLLLNTSMTPRAVTLKHWVRNFDGAVVSQETREIQLAPGEKLGRELAVKAPASRDILFCEVAAMDKQTGQEVFARTNLTVLPPHDYQSTSENSLFGMAAYWPIPSEADVQRVMERMGVRWLRNGDTRQYKNITAIHHSNVKWTGEGVMKPEEREAWIRKELQACIDQKNPWWEFGNELNMSTAGIGLEGIGIGKALLAEKYVEWLKEIRRVQRKMGAMQVKILSFGMAGMDRKFAEKMHALGGWDLIDGFALHPGRGNFTPDYPVSLPAEKWVVGSSGSYWNYYGSLRTTQEIIRQYGGNKPLWLTEVYTPTYPNSFWEDSLRHATENVVLSFALAKAENVQAVMWYQLFDSVWADRLGVNNKDREYHFGLINRDLSFKPMVLAYCTIAEALDGAKFSGWIKFRDAQSRGLLFTTPRGPVAVLWNRTDGYVLSEKSKPFASPEPWVDTWKSRIPVELPAAVPALTQINPIGRAESLPARNGTARVILTGAPTILYGLDAAKLELAPK